MRVSFVQLSSDMEEVVLQIIRNLKMKKVHSSSRIRNGVLKVRQTLSMVKSLELFISELFKHIFVYDYNNRLTSEMYFHKFLF